MSVKDQDYRLAPIDAQPAEVRFQDLSPEYAEIMVLGKVLQMSGYFKDVRDQAQAVTKILFGRELGISPINSMGAIHIIEGKPTLSSNLLAALIKRSGKYDYRVTSSNAAECSIVFLQCVAGSSATLHYPDGTDVVVKDREYLGTSSFTMDDAKVAGVANKTNWKNYPKAMLFARALSQGEKTYCPDVSVCALYVPEELGATVNESGEVVDLPTSAKPIAVVAEPKTFTRPAAVNNSAGETVKGTGGIQATPEPPPSPAENHVPALADALIKAVAPDEETIDLGHQRALHRAFKDAIPAGAAETTHKSAPVIFREWLKHEGFFGEDGLGSTRRIPVLLFNEIKDKAVKFAGTLR